VAKEERPEVFGIPDDDHARAGFLDEIEQAVQLMVAPAPNRDGPDEVF
jgi:hypothetical protein